MFYYKRPENIDESPRLYFVRTNRKGQGTLFTCYTSLKTVNARTDLINEKSKHYNDEHFKKAVVILGFFTAGQLKILADNENKKNFEVQPSKLL